MERNQEQVEGSQEIRMEHGGNIQEGGQAGEWKEYSRYFKIQ